MTYRCVSCGGPLSEDRSALKCASCGAGYPVLDGRLPVLVADAEAYLAAALVHAVAEGDRSGAAYLESLLALLEPHVSLDALLAAPETSPVARPAPAAGTERYSLAQYARRDWSREPECEEEIALVRDAVTAAIAAHAGERDTVLVLGAGLGRHGADLLDLFDEVHCVDWSFEVAATFQLLRRAPLRLADQTRNVRETAVTAEVNLPAMPGYVDRLRYAIADARALPFADASFPCVVSIFFSDMLPDAALTADALRVLRPGGQFVHFGPLRATAGHFREALETAAYEVQSETWVQHPLLDSARALERTVYESLCLSARKGAVGDLRDETVLTIPRPLELRLSGALGAGGRVESGYALAPDVGAVRLTGAAIEALERVDGDLSVRELLSAGETDSVRRELARLVALGLLAEAPIHTQG